MFFSPNRRARSRSPRPALIGLAAAGLLVSAQGCGSSIGLQRGARGLFDVFQEPPPTDAVEQATNQYNADDRYQGLLTLSNASFGGEPPYLALYRDSVDDADPGVRSVAIRALGLHGDPEDVPVMVEALADGSSLVRETAARALQKVHNPVAIEPLIERVKIRNEIEANVRAQAAHALGQYRTPLVLQELIGALDDPSLSVNHHTLNALETLTGQNLGLDRVAWLEWVDQTPDPFAAGRMYTYPGFSRPRHPVEWLPFVPPPPNVPDAPPVGLPRVDG